MKKLIADVNPGDTIRTYHGQYGSADWFVKSIEWDTTKPLVVVNGQLMFDKCERVEVVKDGNHL